VSEVTGEGTRDVAALVRRLDAGDRRALARLLTLVEDGTRGQQRDVIAELHPRAGNARLLGITGAPGVGKSSVTSALITELRRRGRRVGVLAVDPSSPLTGGALLGDRIRMQDHHGDVDVFVRSIAARGHLGGLAAAVPSAALVLDAAGFDDVLIETVGVGQSEVDVAAMADTTLVVLAPGLGDSVQAAKAGILEIADVLVVNKADQPGSGRLTAELEGMLALGAAVAADARHASGGPGGWRPPVLATVAVRGEGVVDVVDAIDAHGRTVAAAEPDARAVARARRWIVELAAGRLRDVLTVPGGPLDRRLSELATDVAARRIDPMRAAEQLQDGDDA
jgi:LAO/AO transport system kinase